MASGRVNTELPGPIVEDDEDHFTGGWDDEDTTIFLFWLVMVLACVLVAVVAWLNRHRILDAFRRSKAKYFAPRATFVRNRVPQPVPNTTATIPPVAAPPVVPPPVPPPPGAPPSQLRQIGARRSIAELIHWQWVMTGKPPTPPTPQREFRSRSQAIDSSHFRSRQVSWRSGGTTSWLSTTTSRDSIKFSISGGDSSSFSGIFDSIPSEPQSMDSRKASGIGISDRRFNHLLGWICSVTDLQLKKEIFDLTFDMIQLGAWTEEEWQLFVEYLFRQHPEGADLLYHWHHDFVVRGLKFPDIMRGIMNQWLCMCGIEAADIKEIYGAFERCGKKEIALNAAVNVALALRKKQGRATSESVDPFSEADDTPLGSFEDCAGADSFNPHMARKC